METATSEYTSSAAWPSPGKASFLCHYYKFIFFVCSSGNHHPRFDWKWTDTLLAESGHQEIADHIPSFLTNYR
jgi:hypothetical protein